MFFPFRTHSTSISKVANENEENENEESDDEELDNAIQEVDKEEKMLFVYRNYKLSRLYRRYSRNLILLDATCKTTEYASPLYFVVLQTNVNYQVVVHFIFVI